MRHYFLAALVLSAVTLTCVRADQPLIAPEDYPEYQLSNFRVEDDDFGRPNIVADYKRTRKGKRTQLVHVAAKNSDGELNIMRFPVGWDESGEIRLSKMFRIGGDRAYDYEIYLVANADWAGKPYGQCMVSNAVRMGKPGEPTKARPLNDEERAAYEKNKLADVPPETTPEGLTAVTLSTNLVPGMAVMAGSYGDWKEAELMGFTEDDKAVLRFIGEKRVIRRPREKWLAVDPQLLRQAEADPSQFEPSGVVLKDGNYPIPNDARPLDSSVKIVRGTPLLYERAGQWKVAYVLLENADGIRVHYEDMDSAFDEEKPRTTFAIRNTILQQLGTPATVAKFAFNVPHPSEFGRREFGSSRAGAGHKIRHEYPITEPIPRGAQRIPNDLVLPNGTTLAVCQGLQWRRVTVVNDNEDGTVEIDWYDRDSVWDGDVSRDQMIIETKTLKKLLKAASSKADQLSTKVRTWRDRSGTYTIEARLVRKTDTEVTLKTNEGLEITLAIEKLSDQDQDLLSTSDPADENPFAP